jgi:hypothetical protein
MPKKRVIKDPNKYVWSLEKGYGNIPARPLVEPALKEFEGTFMTTVEQAKQAILGVWK